MKSFSFWSYCDFGFGSQKWILDKKHLLGKFLILKSSYPFAVSPKFVINFPNGWQEVGKYYQSSKIKYYSAICEKLEPSPCMNEGLVIFGQIDSCVGTAIRYSRVHQVQSREYIWKLIGWHSISFSFNSQRRWISLRFIVLFKSREYTKYVQSRDYIMYRAEMTGTYHLATTTQVWGTK